MSQFYARSDGYSISRHSDPRWCMIPEWFIPSTNVIFTTYIRGHLNIRCQNMVFDRVKKWLAECRFHWIQVATWEKIEECRLMKQKMNSTKSERIKNQLRTQYSTLNKDVKKMTRADKKAYVENLAEEVEQAAGRQDLKTLYSITKTLNGKSTHSNVPVRDEEG